MLRERFICMLAGTALLAGQAQAVGFEDLFKKNPILDSVSLLQTVWRGAAVGGTTGLSYGWARYSEANNQGDVGRSTAVGALAGIGFGLGAELIGRRVEGNMVLSDVGFGGRVGGSIGVLWGTVAAAFTGDTRRIANDTAWGQLAGAALGAGYAGYRLVTGEYDEQKGAEKIPVPGIPPVFGMTPAVSGDGVPMVKIEHRF